MHDKNGTPLKDGDKVRFTGRIKSSTGGASFCNVTVEAAETPEGEDVGAGPVLTCNSRFFEKVEEEAAEEQEQQASEK